MINDQRLESFLGHQRQTGNSLQYIGSQIYHCYALNTVPRYQDPKCLVQHGYRVYSQNDEDGIVAEILRRIGTGTGTCVEIGVGDGLENNTLHLLMNGWRGFWIDGNAEQVSKIEDRCAGMIKQGRLSVRRSFIDTGNVHALLNGLDVPADCDLLSIDIDGNDYWIWEAIKGHQPKIVVIEYNAGMGPHADWKLKYDPKWTWKGTRNFGASLKSLELLGQKKGYCLVGCSIKGMNAFFVREDLIGNRFQEPFTSEQHFEPPRYYLTFPTGHRKDPEELHSFGI